jgi:HEAT repeat protein
MAEGILSDHSRNGEVPEGEDTGGGGSKEPQDDESEKKLDYFIGMLRSENVGWRWKAAESLARLGDLRAVDPLIGALSDVDWRVRQKAAWALGYLGDPRAVIPLRRAYPNEREGVQEIIMEALDMIRDRMARR